MIARTIKDQLLHYANKYPVVTLTGPRQSGKSTLLNNCLIDHHYVSLEEPDVRYLAKNDPKGFLHSLPHKSIIDEAQHVPDLFSYIQTLTDRENRPGMFVLSGSQNFLLMQNITQSLAGRVAVLKLMPFSYQELSEAKLAPTTADEVIWKGGYPRLYDWNLQPSEFFPHYIQTYVERDVRLLRNIPDLSLFIRFIKLCAGRIGQLFNLSSLANECGITTSTAQSWLSILEAGYVLFLLKPYHKNFNKRLTKSPKLYFYDTGLACSLLSIESPSQLNLHYLRGALFENWVILEYFKKSHHLVKEPLAYFWRDSNGNEVDLLLEKGDHLEAIEIKSNDTMNSTHFKGLDYWQRLSGALPASCHLVYTGEHNFNTAKGNYISWIKWPLELETIHK
ncbi:MAG: ATP-binding protein [Prevotellaceae bacterium]|jgi:predicted AAA+ superfamily ATPase|nr:ATP-binding protein [Prevotellaceae bacterium]